MSSSNASASSKAKRTAEKEGHISSQPPKKVQKVHPFFAKEPEERIGTFKWQEPLGQAKSCLHGTNLSPPSRVKLATFDLDGTVIKSSYGKGAVNHGKQFEWWRSDVVPQKLKDVHQDGFSVIFISNQNLKNLQLKAWKEKISSIAASLPDLPFRILAATAKDGFRKPMPGMWYEMERIFREDGVTIDKSQSYYVGDAAGRKGDFASTDRKWAANVGLPFFTPEEFFLEQAPASFVLPGFNVSSLPNLPSYTPSSSPLISDKSKGQLPEIVLFVGYPCVGKSSFFRRHFLPAGYVHVNQDLLGSRPKCLKAVEAALSEEKSCIVDNTNRDVRTRAQYIDIAKKKKVPIRCFIFTASMDLAWHNNLYRAFNLPISVAEKESRRELLPYGAFTGFRDNYEEPQISEGFQEVKKVNWVFDGSEEERERWSMWHQIDGK